MLDQGIWCLSEFKTSSIWIKLLSYCYADETNDTYEILFKWNLIQQAYQQ